ncbi:uncharacterized protein LY79DRAFT_583362 [Colletotrichum navitas]|uniref:Uncharacterized protein n=1 Tax=Colletotrichum navitas TaxID=681940 RepID=A0AAD8PP87_9PEZI|nr:uncharacterized protein LY79DRAFT_583362 [Colletotrichum navitas]KAK1573865.1 hypothetical protein LY79DRAFT_583362 [Colletotrichum navitas]
MAREGTRSQTGNSKPRVFPVVDTAPARKQTTATPATAKKPKTTTSTASKVAKPVGVTKKKATTAKKGPSVVTKRLSILSSVGLEANHFPQAKSVAKKAETKAAGATKAAKKVCSAASQTHAPLSISPANPRAGDQAQDLQGQGDACRGLSVPVVFSRLFSPGRLPARLVVV